MIKISIILLVVLCAPIYARKHNHRKTRNMTRSLPNYFEFGVSTSAYQIEGAWNIDGRGWSYWDNVARTNPEKISNKSNGDITANSYYLYKRDVQMLKELGVENYRFSVSWSRILPNGRVDYINPAGIAYYNALIDELIANGITPFLTMYHLDIPYDLLKQGGWFLENIIEWFEDYARVLFKHFGDRVKRWVTINEPYIQCYYDYPSEKFYQCGKHMLLVNARAYHIYDEEFRPEQGGMIGFATDMDWAMPLTGSDEDAQAALDFKAFHVDYYMHPIFSSQGNYHEILIRKVADASAREGLNASKLHPLSQEEIDYIKGTSDFLGLNHYSSKYVYRNESVAGMYEIPSVNNDKNVGEFVDPSWPYEGLTYDYSPGFYQLLIYIKETYNNPKIYITENGFGIRGTGLKDDGRVRYIRNYLSSVSQAIDEGVNILGYFVWSLMDCFEWVEGYNVRFGLYEIDMNDPNRTRVPRKSALVYKEIVRTKTIDYRYNPDPYVSGSKRIRQENLMISILMTALILCYYFY